jgi:DNA ligase-1
MADLADGASTEVSGSGAKPYVLKNIGGVYSCSCPAWRNQSAPPERRTCKHLKALRGEAAELTRVGGSATRRSRSRRRTRASAAAPTDEVEDGEAPPVLLAHTCGTTSRTSRAGG